MRYSVNGIVISKNINDEYASLENDRIDLEEMLSTYNLVSNIKAIESFGYKATEGLGEDSTISKLKVMAQKIKLKLLEWIRKLKNFIIKVFNNIKSLFIHKQVLKEINDFDAFLDDMLANPEKLQDKESFSTENDNEEINSALNSFGASTTVYRNDLASSGQYHLDFKERCEKLYKTMDIFINTLNESYPSANAKSLGRSLLTMISNPNIKEAMMMLAKQYVDGSGGSVYEYMSKLGAALNIQIDAESLQEQLEKYANKSFKWKCVLKILHATWKMYAVIGASDQNNQTYRNNRSLLEAELTQAMDSLILILNSCISEVGAIGYSIELFTKGKMGFKTSAEISIGAILSLLKKITTNLKSIVFKNAKDQQEVMNRCAKLQQDLGNLETQINAIGDAPSNSKLFDACINTVSACTAGLASVQSTIITKFIGLIKSCKTVLLS